MNYQLFDVLSLNSDHSHRKIHPLCNITTVYVSIIYDQAFHVLSVHRNDCCGLGTATAGIVTDGRTAIFEMFTPFVS